MTAMPDSFAEVQAIIVRLMGLDRSRVTPQARFREDLQADSLDLIEIVLIFEDRLGLEIPYRDYRRIQSTVGEAVEFFDANKVEGRQE
jgi:acyl carrier protein